MGITRKIKSGCYKCYATVATGALKFVSRIADYDFPPTVRIESTNRCNANCTTCTRDKMTRPVGVMDIDLYKKIVDECVKNKLRTLHLHNFGEPLLDPLIFDRIKYAKERGIKSTRIFSNIAALDEDKARKLVESGLDDLKISIDAATKETYESIRRPLKFEKVTGNIEMMMRVRKEMNAKNPRVSLVYVETDQNRHETAAFQKRWQGSVDCVLISSYHNWSGDLEKPGEKTERLMPCLRLWQTLTVLWDGRAALCCLDYDGREIVGDLNTQSIQEVYKGERLKQIRKWHLNWEYEKVPICLNCEGRK